MAQNNGIEIAAEMAALTPVPTVNEERAARALAIQAAELLMLPKRMFTPELLEATQNLGRFLTKPVTANILKVRTFDCMDQIDRAVRVGLAIAENDVLTSDERLRGVSIVTQAVVAGKQLSEQMMELAQQSEDARGDGPRPRNLPPQTLVQVNVSAPKPPLPPESIPEVTISETTNETKQ